MRVHHAYPGPFRATTNGDTAMANNNPSGENQHTKRDGEKSSSAKKSSSGSKSGSSGSGTKSGSGGKSGNKR